MSTQNSNGLASASLLIAPSTNESSSQTSNPRIKLACASASTPGENRPHGQESLPNELQQQQSGSRQSQQERGQQTPKQHQPPPKGPPNLDTSTRNEAPTAQGASGAGPPNLTSTRNEAPTAQGASGAGPPNLTSTRNEAPTTQGANGAGPPNLASTLNGAPTAQGANGAAPPKLKSGAAQSAAQATRQSRTSRFLGLFLLHRGAKRVASIEPEPWKSMVHRSWCLALLILSTLSIIIAVVSICIISSKNQGLADVSVRSTTILGLELGLNITWTTIPTVIFNLFNFWTVAVVRDLAKRQPYVELRKDVKGALASHSVMLEYAAYHPFTAWIHAFRRRHSLLGFCMLLQLVFSIVISGIASSLLTANAVTIQRPAFARPLTNFNDSGFTATSSLLGVFDIASSTQIYGGKLPPFVLPFQSFAGFSGPNLPTDAAGISNFTVNTAAYAVEVGCESVPSDNFLLTPGDGGLSFQANDRGCHLNSDFAGPSRSSSPYNNFTYYLQTLSNTNCGIESGWSRFVAIGAMNTPQGLTNETVISCNTSYFSSKVDLTVRIDPSIQSDPTIQTYNTTQSTSFDPPRPLFADLFETSLPGPTASDPTAALSANDFGRLIFTYARTYNPDAFLTSAILKNATSQMIGTAFALMANQYLVQPLPVDGAQQLQGTLITTKIRLLVVQSIAYTLIGLLVLKVVTTSCTWWYVQNRSAALYEEPRGLLMAARMLKQSDLMTEVETSIDGGGHDVESNLWKVWEKDASLAGSRWRWENWKKPKDAKLAKVP